MECPICLEIIENTENIFVTKCKHEFCNNCIIKWYINNYNDNNNQEYNKSCPICRENINIKIKIISNNENNQIMSKCADFFSLLTTIAFIILILLIIIYIQ